MEIKKILSVITKNRFLFLLGALGLILLLFTGIPSKETAPIDPLAAAESYRLSLEKEIADACSAVKGVGEARVLLTLATTEIAVYEKNQTAESESVALAGGDALLLAYRMPEIAGVSVICRGGGDLTIKAELTALLCKALDLDTTAIHIAALK